MRGNHGRAGIAVQDLFNCRSIGNAAAAVDDIAVQRYVRDNKCRNAELFGCGKLFVQESKLLIGNDIGCKLFLGRCARRGHEDKLASFDNGRIPEVVAVAADLIAHCAVSGNLGRERIQQRVAVVFGGVFVIDVEFVIAVDNKRRASSIVEIVLHKAVKTGKLFGRTVVDKVAGDNGERRIVGNDVVDHASTVGRHFRPIVLQVDIRDRIEREERRFGFIPMSFGNIVPIDNIILAGSGKMNRKTGSTRCKNAVAGGGIGRRAFGKLHGSKRRVAAHHTVRICEVHRNAGVSGSFFGRDDRKRTVGNAGAVVGILVGNNILVFNRIPDSVKVDIRAVHFNGSNRRRAALGQRPAGKDKAAANGCNIGNFNRAGKKRGVLRCAAAAACMVANHGVRNERKVVVIHRTALVLSIHWVAI